VGVDASERPITVDQSNYSIVVGEAVVVKWLVPAVAAPHPGTQLLTHLRSVGFADMPAFHGELIEDGWVRAIITGFVPGALDGWDWCVDELEQALRHDSQLATPLQSVARIATMTAHLHRALSTPSPTIPDPVGTADLATEADRGEGLLSEALREVTGDAALVVLRHRDHIADKLQSLRTAGPSVTHPIHGDLHVGQVLRSQDTLLLNDFDGDPVTPPGHRVLRRSPLIDLASLLQSFDHVGRIVIRRRLPSMQRAVDDYIEHAQAIATATYERELGVDLADEHESLFALRVAQELHEMIYAHRTLPRWMYVPQAALATLMAG
jgi:maltokinase